MQHPYDLIAAAAHGRGSAMRPQQLQQLLLLQPVSAGFVFGCLVLGFLSAGMLGVDRAGIGGGGGLGPSGGLIGRAGGVSGGWGWVGQ